MTVRDGNILVGPNNSGKSSILDALRLLDACYRYSQRKRPKLIAYEGTYFDGYEIAESSLPISIANVARNYSEQDAQIRFFHQNDTIASICLHPDRLTKFFVNSDGKRFSTSNKLRSAFPIHLVIVPTLSPLESQESYVSDETVQRNRTTRLAARSFRNIWFRESDEVFELWKRRVEAAWPGVSIQKPELVREQSLRLEMFFSENRITREIQWAGFGFQVWLQIHMHLLRAKQDSILILDEPDIYLHPDLQRRLYHEVKKIFGQYFFATHAPEIINEADTKEIIVVNPDARAGKRVKNDSDYTGMLSYIGSAENADFAKISRIKKVIFVEGHDAKLLRRFAARLNLDELSSDQTAPIFQLGGFSEWRRAKNTVWAFRELLGLEIKTICVFDRDYRSKKEIDAFVNEMDRDGIRCLILNRKEIENYLLVPDAIARIVSSKRDREHAAVHSAEILELICEAAEAQKHVTHAQISTNALRYEQECRTKEDSSTVMRRSMEAFEAEWLSAEGKIRLGPGKEIVKTLMQRLREEQSVSISLAMIVNSLRRGEIASDLQEILAELNGFVR